MLSHVIRFFREFLLEWKVFGWCLLLMMWCFSGEVFIACLSFKRWTNSFHFVFYEWALPMWSKLAATASSVKSVKEKLYHRLQNFIRIDKNAPKSNRIGFLRNDFMASSTIKKLSVESSITSWAISLWIHRIFPLIVVYISDGSTLNAIHLSKWLCLYYYSYYSANMFKY